jgi:hypothetical protein
MFNARYANPTIFNAHAPPNVWRFRGRGESRTEQVSKTQRPFREHLIRMPVGVLHY